MHNICAEIRDIQKVLLYLHHSPKALLQWVQFHLESSNT